MLLLLLLGNDWYGNNTPLSVTTNDDSTAVDSIVNDVDAFAYSNGNDNDDTNDHDTGVSDEDTHVNNGREGNGDNGDATEEVTDGDDGSIGGTDTGNENGNGSDVGNSNDDSNNDSSGGSDGGSSGGSSDDNANSDDELPEDGIFVIPESPIGVVSIGLASIASLVVYLMMRGRIGV